MEKNNNNQIAIEIIRFAKIDKYNDDEFVEMIDKLEKDFHINQKGYIDTKLTRGKEAGSWIMIQHWDSLEEAREANKKFVQSPLTEKFRNSLDPQSVSLFFTDQTKFWEKESSFH